MLDWGLRNERLQARLAAEGGKQLACEVTGVGGIVEIFPADIVVEDTPLRCPMDMRKREIHAVPLNRPGHTADKNNGAVQVLALDDADMGEGIIDQAVAVVIPCVIEEYQISRTHDGPLVDFAMAPDVMVDKPHTIGFGIRGTALVEIDTVREKDGACHAGAVVGDPFAVDLNGGRSDQLGCRLHDGRST